MLLYQILASTIHGKIQKIHSNLNYQLQHGMIDLSFLMDHIKKHEVKALTDNSPIKIYATKIENRITFKIKIGYCFKIFTLKNRKLLGRIENKIIKDISIKNVPHLETNEVLSVCCNIVNNYYQKLSIHLFQINYLVNYE